MSVRKLVSIYPQTEDKLIDLKAELMKAHRKFISYGDVIESLVAEAYHKLCKTHELPRIADLDNGETDGKSL